MFLTLELDKLQRDKARIQISKVCIKNSIGTLKTKLLT